jgi:uncharacterized protein DUF6965
MGKEIEIPSIEKLRAFFASATVPKTLRLDSGTMIIDSDQFIKCQLSILDSGNGQAATRPAFDRLHSLFVLLSTQK